ncbi:MAG: universal stress protein [Nitrospirota bacterium]|nr:universal stress protein [Nitrospirota bacterium]
MAETQSGSDKITSDPSDVVLVAVDFSPDSEAALVWASRFASHSDAGLMVLHVVHDPGDAPGYYRRGEKDVLRPMEDVAKEMLEEFLEKFRGDHPEVAAVGKLEIKLVRGLPASRILEAAESANASLIVMGSRGRTGLPHFLLGSKAERVVQLSSIPVVVVKAKRSEN